MVTVSESEKTFNKQYHTVLTMSVIDHQSVVVNTRGQHSRSTLVVNTRNLIASLNQQDLTDIYFIVV